MLFVKELTEN